MSLALDYAPIPAVEPRRRPLTLCPPPGISGSRPASVPVPLAAVHVLKAPLAAPLAWHLTRRGVLAVSLLVAALGAALVWLAASSAPASSTPTPTTGPAVVTVEQGDTLWSIASRVAPGRDPRAEVAHLQQVNHLPGVELVTGQSLRVR